MKDKSFCFVFSSSEICLLLEPIINFFLLNIFSSQKNFLQKCGLVARTPHQTGGSSSYSCTAHFKPNSNSTFQPVLLDPSLNFRSFSSLALVSAERGGGVLQPAGLEARRSCSQEDLQPAGPAASRTCSQQALQPAGPAASRTGTVVESQQQSCRGPGEACRLGLAENEAKVPKTI